MIHDLILGVVCSCSGCFFGAAGVLMVHLNRWKKLVAAANELDAARLEQIAALREALLKLGVHV
jgi:hypothetical protein